MASPGSRRHGSRCRRAQGLRARNTHARSRRGIAAHYDLGNELFALMLDRDDDVLLRILPAPGDDTHAGIESEARAGMRARSICEPAITCSRSARDGAGSPSTPTRTRGCRVTTTTISREQYEHACEWVRDGRSHRSSHGAVRGLSRPTRTLREARLHRDDRGRRISRLRHVLCALLETCWPLTGGCCYRR